MLKKEEVMGRKGKIELQKSKLLAQLDQEGQDSSEETKQGSYFKEFYDKNFSAGKFAVGSVVKGRIVEVDEDYVVVDVNYKSEGLIPKSEFQGPEGLTGASVGSEIEVYIDSIENENGMMALSKDRADIIRVWKDISQTARNQESIEGTVISKVKGGLQVDIGGVKAFLPGSQLELRPVRNLNQYLGQKYMFKIIKFNQKRGNIVLSRRVILEEERESLRSQTLEGLDKGTLVNGIVKNITDYGAFLDLGGIDGLLHITDISWSRIKHPSEKLSVGDKIQVKVLKFDREKKRVSLGLKQLVEGENPWEKISEEIKEGDEVKGRITSFTDYGAFVAVKDGVEGLIHISEMSWGKKVKKPEEILKIGDEVNLKVIQVDQDHQRISFSIKRLQENPMDEWVKKYPKGSIIESAIVQSITDFGLIVKWEEVEGVIRSGDLAWSSRGAGGKSKYQIGDSVKAMVLDFSLEEERFHLGVKQLHKNPWDEIESLYSIGSVYSVKVVKIVDFGAFVALGEKGVEGLIHISELDTKRVQKVEDVIKVGDVIQAEVITMDKESHKIGLSAKLVKLRKEAGESVEEDSEKPSEKELKKPEEKKESFFAKALRASISKTRTAEEPSAKDTEEPSIENTEESSVKNKDSEKPSSGNESNV